MGKPSYKNAAKAKDIKLKTGSAEEQLSIKKKEKCLRTKVVAKDTGRFLRCIK